MTKHEHFSKEHITARDLSTEGDGIGVLSNGKTVFVPGLLPQEEADILPVRENNAYCTGRIISLTRPSPFRTDPVCPSAPDCGGCTVRHMNYDGQLLFKRSRVASCLSRIGGFTDFPVDPCVPSPLISGYRNKLAFPVKMHEGKIVFGCYKSRSHELVSADRCLLHSDKMMSCVNRMCDFLTSAHVSAYDEATGKGCVRHVVVRESSSGEILAGFVVNDGSFPYEKAKKTLADAADTIVVNKNSSGTNIILGNETDILTGSGTVTETILGKNFTVSVNTFLQVNHRQAENLYRLALEYADIKSTDTVADLYCGIGTITLCAAPLAKKIYGIEIVPQSIENASKNALLNNISNAEFICADTGEGFAKVLDSSGHIDCIIVDPPRKGLSDEAIKAIVSARSERIVYVSCDPATLARDLRILTSSGYNLVKATPVDMFPMTTHVETVVCLRRS